MSKQVFFYAIHDSEDETLINYINGPFDTQQEALDEAAANCCTGEPGDPVITEETLSHKDNLGSQQWFFDERLTITITAQRRSN